MTQKEIEKFLTNTKVYVNGKSKEIQEKLFSFGYGWNFGNPTKLGKIDIPFLFIHKNRCVTYVDDMCYFKEHDYREITAEQILALELTEPIYRPFKNIEECWQEMLKHQPFGWVKLIDTGYFANIATASDCGIMFREDKEYFYYTALKEYTFADDTPFGIKRD